MKKLIFGSVSLACVVITVASSALAGGGCGGGVSVCHEFALS